LARFIVAADAKKASNRPPNTIFGNKFNNAPPTMNHQPPLNQRLPVFITLLAANVALGAPLNDNFADRIVLSGAPVMAAGTTVEGTLEDGEPPVFQMLSTVWYEWVAPAHGSLRVRLLASSDYMFGQMYFGNNLPQLQGYVQFRSGDEANVEVQQGAAYQFRISTAQPQPEPRLDGPFTLRLEYNSAPVNDHFTNRIRLSNAVERISFRNVLASLEDGESPIGSAGGGYSLWYEWRAPASGVAHLLVDNSHRTVVGVYAGTPTDRGMMITNNVLEGGRTVLMS
jgi:hypothetical protein